MLHKIISYINQFYGAKNRWWLPLVCGLLYSLALPPFNHEFSPLFALFPFLSLLVLIPLFLFATRDNVRRALFHSFLFGFTASMGQYYWIGFVTAEGLWHLILIGLVLISATVALFYLSAAILFRFAKKYLPRLYILVFPACWVLIDYLRTIGDISFPWAFLGYTFTPVLPIAQLASITGVWGLTYLIVLGNVLLYEVALSYKYNADQTQKWLHAFIFMIFLSGLFVWGWNRLGRETPGEKISVSCLQPNIDQFHWGKNSLDSAFSSTEKLLSEASKSKPDLLILPESALLCYLDRTAKHKDKVLAWSNTFRVPMILGSLHWDWPANPNSEDYNVYNTAFLIDTGRLDFQPYFKIKLVPFSEIMPFEARFPILSRVNLGEADFKRGKENTIFSICNNKIKAAPFICYEAIFPGFVQERFAKDANLMVCVTNDGWFGKTTGPYHHATMARLRAIENGASMVRAANSGMSMIVDQRGRVLGITRLYKKAILNGTVSIGRDQTFYSKHGDWFIGICALLVGLSFSVVALLKLASIAGISIRK